MTILIVTLKKRENLFDSNTPNFSRIKAQTSPYTLCIYLTLYKPHTLCSALPASLVTLRAAWQALLAWEALFTGCVALTMATIATLILYRTT